MTDRVRTATVVFDADYRTDDVEAILNTIRMIKGVASVTTPHVMQISDYLAREALRHEVRTKLVEAIDTLIFPPRPMP
jgi:hypothetical protein